MKKNFSSHLGVVTYLFKEISTAAEFFGCGKIANDFLIEGNEFPSYGLIQNYLLDKDNPGHLKQIKDVIGDEIKNIKL